MRILDDDKSQTLAAGLARQLESEIVNGTIAPGSELDERGLAERFGVSRTPIREALRQLAVDGMVEMRPRRRSVVRTLNTQRLAQMFEVLAGLEALAAECAARRMTGDQLRELAEIHEQIGMAIEDVSGDDFDRLNHEFHRRIYIGACNSYLHEQAEMLRGRLAPYRRWLLRKLNRMRQSHREHSAILAAIMEGDGDRASVEMRRHVRDGDRFVDFLMGDPEPAGRLAR